MWRSALDMTYQGTPNSTTPKTTIHPKLRRSAPHARWCVTKGVSSTQAGAVRPRTKMPGSTWRTATRINK